MSTINKIENDFLRVEVNPVGAELYGILNKKTNREVLWQGNPDFWSSRAPVLFPIVGGLKNNTIKINGGDYEMPRHGIVRGNTGMEVVKHTDKDVCFQLSANEASLLKYPYRFVFNIRFTLKENILEVRHIVKNEDDKRLYFSVGAHPAFNCPFVEGHQYNEYYIEFESDEKFESWRLNSEGLINTDIEKIAEPGNILPLHDHIFDRDALIFTQLKSRKVSLKHKTLPENITIHYSDFSYLGIWAKPGAPFVCIEPWIGYADKWNTTQKIEEKEGMLSLEPGEEFHASYFIEVN